jgi:hypothetical protein
MAALGATINAGLWLVRRSGLSQDPVGLFITTFGALHTGLGKGGGHGFDHRYLLLLRFGLEGLASAVGLDLIATPTAFEQPIAGEHQGSALGTEHSSIADLRLKE